VEFPEHKCSLTLTHNPQRDEYMTAAQYIAEDDTRECPFDWVSPEQKQKAIDTDEIWELMWYPITPIGSHMLAAADLEVLLERAKTCGQVKN
jgi:hypothetical protein